MWIFRREGTPQWLRRKIARLPEQGVVSSAFETAIAERRDRSKDVWYHSQKEHWLGWLAEYDGPGYYGRRTWNVTAERVYNRIVNPSMLIWLAEASGVPSGTVQKASDAALAAAPNMSAQSAAIRCVIPWVLVEAHLK